MTTPVDSPVEWVSDHIECYVATGGQEGHVFHGATALLLTTTGRSSGQQRRTALYYVPDGDRWIVVASSGGAPSHPAWYLNLLADPHCTVQVLDRVVSCVATTAGPSERPRLWEASLENWPPYAEYQTQTDRQIPVVILTPVGDQATA